MRALLIAIAVAAAIPAVAEAEIVKTAVVDDTCQGICTNWWPKLTLPDGWVFDEAFSRDNNINFFYPKDDPNNVGIYAGALTPDGQADTLAGFIADDSQNTLDNNPGATIVPGPDFTTADGQVLHSRILQPLDGKNLDITAYGEETDGDGNQYYLTFTLSAPTKAQYDQYMPVYQQALAAYHK